MHVDLPEDIEGPFKIAAAGSSIFVCAHELFIYGIGIEATLSRWPLPLVPVQVCARELADGRTLLVVAGDGLVAVWHGKEMWTWRTPQSTYPITALSADSSGLLVACGSDGKDVNVCQSELGELFARLQHATPPTAMEFGGSKSTSHLLFTASRDCAILVWDLALKRLVHRCVIAARTSPLACLAATDDILAAGTSDGTLWLFNIVIAPAADATLALPLAHRVNLRRAAAAEMGLNAVNTYEAAAAPLGNDGGNNGFGFGRGNSDNAGWVERSAEPLAMAFVTAVAACAAGCETVNDAAAPLHGGAGVLELSRRPESRLVVALASGIVVVNPREGTVETIQPLSGSELEAADQPAAAFAGAATAAAVAGSCSSSNGENGYCAAFVSGLLPSALVLQRGSCRFLTAAQDEPLSFLQRRQHPLPRDSPLLRELEAAPLPARPSAAGGRAAAAATGCGKGKAPATATATLPVMFHAKIRSSGYGKDTAPAALFQWRSSSATTDRKKPLLAAKAVQAGRALLSEYPLNCGLLDKRLPLEDFPARSGSGNSGKLAAAAAAAATAMPPILSIAYSADGRRLALSTTEEAVLALRLPVAEHKAQFDRLLGHAAGAVASMATGHDANLSLSASADGTARLWIRGCDEAAIVFGGSAKRGSVCWRRPATATAVSAATTAVAAAATTAGEDRLASAKEAAGSCLRRDDGSVKLPRQAAVGASASALLDLGKGGERRQLAPPIQIASSSAAAAAGSAGSVTRACFFQLDRFVVLAREASSSVELFSYRLPNGSAAAAAKRNGAARKLSDPRQGHCAATDAGGYRVAHRWTLGEAKEATWIECPNSVLSPIILAAGSDRSVHVLDAASGATARVMRSTHAKAVHMLALPPPAAFGAAGTAAAGACDVFATAAADGAAALWDLRQNRCCARFTEHVNRRGRVALAMSPCLRYLVVGSEDRSCYLYELRTGTVAARLTGHGDTVTAAAFHPLKPRLATASLDGTVRFWGESTVAAAAGAAAVLGEPALAPALF